MKYFYIDEGGWFGNASYMLSESELDLDEESNYIYMGLFTDLAINIWLGRLKELYPMCKITQVSGTK